MDENVVMRSKSSPHWYVGSINGVCSISWVSEHNAHNAMIFDRDAYKWAKLLGSIDGSIPIEPVYYPSMRPMGIGIGNLISDVSDENLEWITKNGEITFEKSTGIYTAWDETYADWVCKTNYPGIAKDALKLYCEYLNDGPGCESIKTGLIVLPGDRPRIICLCGSTRFYDDFKRVNYELTMQGFIVLSVGFYSKSGIKAHGQEIGCTPDQKIMLDELHKRKIDIADEVLCINVDGYIGESTRSEINYAKETGKPVSYVEPLMVGDMKWKNSVRTI